MFLHYFSVLIVFSKCTLPDINPDRKLFQIKLENTKG